MRLAPRIFGQSLGILALSAALAFGVNALRPDGLPLANAATKSSVQLDSSGGEIAIKDAALLFISGRAVFLDARSQLEYEMGHVQGALSLPPREFAAQFQDIKPALQGKEAVITYCDGERCPLSIALAKHLRDAGVKNVYVLKNGWTLWQAEKLPTAKGAAMSRMPGAQTGQAGKSGQEGICRDCDNK
jgi:rhodanese-related sulfurtransferase